MVDKYDKCLPLLCCVLTTDHFPLYSFPGITVIRSPSFDCISRRMHTTRHRFEVVRTPDRVLTVVDWLSMRTSRVPCPWFTYALQHAGIMVSVRHSRPPLHAGSSTTYQEQLYKTMKIIERDRNQRRNISPPQPDELSGARIRPEIRTCST